jgi:hypothetical protein
MRNRGLMLYLLLCILLQAKSAPAKSLAELPGRANPPRAAVKLVFIHQATGGHWLADPKEGKPYGGLGRALMENNYFVSATNSGWGPNDIGDRTDILDWPEWFLGPDREIILDDLYSETGQHVYGFGDWSRLGRDPGGENLIIMFKSRPLNSHLVGSPGDPPLDVPRPWDTSVANAKAVYLTLLDYFRYRPDKLFLVITAPPLAHDATTSEHAANARAFNTWLVHEWLRDYPYANVAVFDYYNVLTASDNHHHWNGTEIEHLRPTPGNVSAYVGADGHVAAEGHRKATAEFVPLLNVYYNRWQAAKITTLAPEKPASQAPPSGFVVDDFEAELVWHADEGEGARVACSLVANAHGGSRALRLTYAIPEERRSGCWRPFDAPRDWGAYHGLSFRVRGDPVGQEWRLALYAGSPEDPIPYAARFAVTPDWNLVTLSWEDFVRAPWANGIDSSAPDPSRVTRLGFVAETGEGTLDIDDLVLLDELVTTASSEAASPITIPLMVTMAPLSEQQLPAQLPAETPRARVEDAVPEPSPLVTYFYALIPLGLLAVILAFVLLRRHAGPRKPRLRQDPTRKED